MFLSDGCINEKPVGGAASLLAAGPCDGKLASSKIGRSGRITAERDDYSCAEISSAVDG